MEYTSWYFLTIYRLLTYLLEKSYRSGFRPFRQSKDGKKGNIAIIAITGIMAIAVCMVIAAITGIRAITAIVLALEPILANTSTTPNIEINY